MPDLFGSIVPEDQGELFAPQTPVSQPTFAAPLPLPASPQARKTESESAARYRRWLNRPWGKSDATDKRIARQYNDTTSTGDMYER